MLDRSFAKDAGNAGDEDVALTPKRAAGNSTSVVAPLRAVVAIKGPRKG